jgi:hypothetical protein
MMLVMMILNAGASHLSSTSATIILTTSTYLILQRCGCLRLELDTGNVTYHDQITRVGRFPLE